MKMLQNLFKKRIYLDYASLTSVDGCVLRDMKKYSSAEYMNPSSLYREGVAAKKVLESARKRVAACIGAHSDEVIFTAGGTESNVIAVIGVVLAAQTRGVAKPHVIFSAIEHSSVYELGKSVERVGGSVTYVPVDVNGVVSVEALRDVITSTTVLISIMTVNNEIGTVQPIREIAKIVRAHNSSNNSAHNNILLHTDAAQALTHLDINVQTLGVDLLSIDGSKIYGPRGSGALFVRRGIQGIQAGQIEPVTRGGGQEKGLRSGTENIPANVGLATALEITTGMRARETARITELRKFFIDELQKICAEIGAGAGAKKIKLDVHGGDNVSPHILNIAIDGIDSEFFILQLDAAGIACSTKSSCLRDADESYVIQAIGAKSANSVRFSFGRKTTKHQLVKTIRTIDGILKNSL